MNLQEGATFMPQRNEFLISSTDIRLSLTCFSVTGSNFEQKALIVLSWFWSNGGWSASTLISSVISTTSERVFVSIEFQVLSWIFLTTAVDGRRVFERNSSCVTHLGLCDCARCSCVELSKTRGFLDDAESLQTIERVMRWLLIVLRKKRSSLFRFFFTFALFCCFVDG